MRVIEKPGVLGEDKEGFQFWWEELDEEALVSGTGDCWVKE